MTGHAKLTQNSIFAVLRIIEAQDDSQKIYRKHKTLYLFEIKFSINEIGLGIVSEVKDKIDKLKLPRGFACLPVLIVANGVSDKVIQEDYFFKIVYMSDLLTIDVK